MTSTSEKTGDGENRGGQLSATAKGKQVARSDPVTQTSVYKSIYANAVPGNAIPGSSIPQVRPRSARLAAQTKSNGSINGMATGMANGVANGEPSSSMNGLTNGATNGDVVPYQGVDLTSEVAQASVPISWHDPHYHFAVILVGPSEIPFGIQKDLLCAQSPWFREEFAKRDGSSLENVFNLPDTDVHVFGCFQCFIYSGLVYDKVNGKPIPDYTQLMGVWKLATKLKMPALRVAVLDVMAERRQQTSCIPGTPLLIQAWKETEEGSGLRRMLIGWAAEHMRAAPEARNDFAKALPQDILSDLVIAMADLPMNGAPQPARHPGTAPHQHASNNNNNELEIYDHQQPPRSSLKRPRKSEVGFAGPSDETYDVKPAIKKAARRSEASSSGGGAGAGAGGGGGSGRKTNTNRRVSQMMDAIPLSADRELNYCRDLIVRMMSGPGYWTRLVGPFKNPVDPKLDNVPNYFDVVKRPMDLRTIHGKMRDGAYANAAEFEADVRLIFQNCYEYWEQEDKPFKDCLAFEKYFNEQWANRHTWKPTIKAEVID